MRERVDAHLLLEKEKEKARKWLRLRDGVKNQTLSQLRAMEERMNRSAEKEKKASRVNKEEEKKKREKLEKSAKKREEAKSTVEHVGGLKVAHGGGPEKERGEAKRVQKRARAAD